MTYDPPELAVADHMQRRRSLAPTQLGKYIGEHTPGTGAADPYQAARNVAPFGNRPVSAYGPGSTAPQHNWYPPQQEQPQPPPPQPQLKSKSGSQQGRPSAPVQSSHRRDISSRHPGHRERREQRIGDFIIKQTLGKGTFSKVCMAEHRATKQKFALKFIKPKSPQGGSTDKHNIRVEREIKLLSLLYHPNIVRLYDVIQNPKFTMIVMEHNSGGELLHHIRKRGRLHESEARALFRQIVSAMDYTHRNCIIHRDLKMENVMLDNEGRIRIIDYGFANTFEWDKQLDTFCGSPFYAAPEMVNGIKYTGPEVDIWSMGVILFFMLCGRTPFEGDLLKEIYDKISRGKFTMPSFLSKDAQGLLQQILTVDPKLRISMKGIIEHPWTNKDQDQPINNHLPARPVVVLQPNDQSLQKMPVYKYDISTVISALARSDLAMTPMVSIYHLVDESRRRKATRNARRSHATNLGSSGPNGSLTDVDSTTPPVLAPASSMGAGHGEAQRPTSRNRHSYAPGYVSSDGSPASRIPSASAGGDRSHRAHPSAPHSHVSAPLQTPQPPYLANRNSDLAVNTDSPSFGASQYEPPRLRKGSTASGQLSIGSSLNLDASSPFLREDDRRASRSSRFFDRMRKSLPFLKTPRSQILDDVPPFDRSQHNVDNRNHRASFFQTPFRRFSAAPSAISLNMQGNRVPSYCLPSHPPPPPPHTQAAPPVSAPMPASAPDAHANVQSADQRRRSHHARPLTATNDSRPAQSAAAQRPATSGGHHRYTDFGPRIQPPLQSPPLVEPHRKSEPPMDLPYDPSTHSDGSAAPRRSARPLSVVSSRQVTPLRLHPAKSLQTNQPPVPFSSHAPAAAQLPAALTSRGSAPTAVRANQQQPLPSKGGVRGIFNLRCTMFGPLDEVQSKIERVLKSKSIVLRKMANVIYSCEDHGMRFEIVVDTLQGQLHLIKFKRLEGNWWAYKKLSAALSSELQSIELVDY
ncbi:hypothetical protein H4R24_004383 [Coemansia sp. RSA 988]|nr:hypothetical protein H4R24_004383 [Coemansia sp. RSA 988]